MVLLVLLLLFAVFSGCTGRNIFVSQCKGSVDADYCGNTTTPCLTIGCALSKISEGDTVNIDGGQILTSPFQYMIGETVIDYSVTLQKWKYDDSSKSPNPVLQKNSPAIRFICFGNVSIASINFHSKKYFPWFYLEFSCRKMHVTNCFFKRYPLGYAIIEYVLFPSDAPMSHKGSIDIRLENSQLSLELDASGYTGSSFIQLDQSSSLLQLKMSEEEVTIDSSIISHAKINLLSNISKLYIRNSTFEYARITISWDSDKTVFLHNSTFKTGVIKIQCMYPRASGSLVTNVSNCIFDNFHVTLIDTTEVFVYNTTFMNGDEREISPILNIYGGDGDLYKGIRSRVYLNRCIFRNNTNSYKRDTPSSLSIWHMYVGIIENTVFYSSAKNPTIATFGSYKKLQIYNTRVICSSGEHTVLDIRKAIHQWINIFFRKYLLYIYGIRCEGCSKGMYNLRGDKITIKRNRWPTYYGTSLGNNRSCIACPHNTICEDGKVHSKGGYWGYANTKNGKSINTLSLIQCPAYYFCPSRHSCISFDTCTDHRIGRLCSECQRGFSSDLSASYRCVPNAQCNHAATTFILYVILAILYVVVMLYLKEIIIFVKTALKSDNDPTSLDDEREEQEWPLRERFLHESVFRGDPSPSIPYQILDTADVNGASYSKSSSVISGSLKILFFYYQAATLVRIQSADKTELLFPRFLDFLSTFFNIQLDMNYSKMSYCVSPDVNVIQAKLIKLGFILAVFTVILMFWIASFVLKRMKKQKQSNSDPELRCHEIIDDNVSSYSSPPFDVRVKCVYVQFLLIGFASIATFLFDSVHCIDVNDESFLFTQASIKCYQPWQYVVIIIIVVWVVPFAISLYVAVKLLHKCHINSSQFLLVLSFPPAIIGLLIKWKVSSKHQSLTTKDAMLAKHLLLVITEPFRESQKDGSKLCWESVLILRRMSLVIVQTFIMSPITKLYPIVVLLLVFQTHHMLLKPFNDPLLNVVEGISMRVLISLVVVNMFWAFTRQSVIMENPMFKVLGKVLIFYEMFVLSLPFTLLLLYLVYSAFKKIRKLYKYVWNRIMHKQD